MVRSHFDYAMIIWNPHAVKYIESIECLQRYNCCYQNTAFKNGT